jgi:hypothetical protein
MTYPTVSRRWRSYWGGLLFPAALVLGVALCATVPKAWSAPVVRPITCGTLLIVAAAMSLYQPARYTVQQIMRSLRRPDPEGRKRLGVLVAFMSALYLFTAAYLNDRPLVPRLLDEKTYTLQSRMLASGLLWRPPHPKAEFFETFYVFDKPLYGAKYFPGTAMMYAPGVWIGIPDWVTSLIIAGAVSGMTCLVTMELFDGDGAAGISASLLLLATNSVHDLGTWVLAHEPVMLCVLIMLYAWMQWRSVGARGWAVLMGAAAGWAAITRPIDALVYALPMAILIGIDLFHMEPQGRRGQLAIDLLVAILAAAPFLVLQGWFDVRMTGHLFETPYRAYIDRYQPGDAYGGIGSDRVPQTMLQQKLDYYYDFILPLVNYYRTQGAWKIFFRLRLAHILKHGMANRLQLILIPAGVAMVWFDRRLLAAALPLPLFALLYAANCSFIWYYPIIIAPALAILTVAGSVALTRWLPTATVIVPLCVIAIALGSMPEVSGDIPSDWDTIAPAPAEQAVADHITAPALVFFTYHSSKMGFHDEPVYNLKTGWPDDEPITRAQDLGPAKDAELIAYYGKLQPERKVYVVDRDSCEVRELGKAGELAARAAEAPSPKPAG